MSSSEDLDLDVEAILAEVITIHDPIFRAVRKALKRPRGQNNSTQAVADRCLTALAPYSVEQLEAAYLWGDSEFRALVEQFPSRLPIEEHTERVRDLMQRWARPLRWLGGIARYIDRRNSKAPEDAHWRRLTQLENRAIKARSKARKKWLQENRRSDSQKAAEARYNEKRKAARRAARGGGR